MPKAFAMITTTTLLKLATHSVIRDIIDSNRDGKMHGKRNGNGTCMPTDKLCACKPSLLLGPLDGLTYYYGDLSPSLQIVH
eukprot:2992202-Amphidinium_carterae.1